MLTSKESTFNKKSPNFGLKIFHKEISGKEIKEDQLKNIKLILITFSRFHFEISGNDFNDEHP